VFAWLANAWKVPELRRRVLFTAAMLAAYRLGSWIPAPGVNPEQLKGFFNQGGVLSFLNLLSGGGLSQFALFGLGVMPYVTASIILQLMTVVVPQLEQLQKEGEAGYAKINQYTRYLTVVLAAAQATGWAFLFKRDPQALPDANAGRLIIIVVTLTAGTTLLMWIGELITKRGIGNGISLLIFASILSSAPEWITAWANGTVQERLFFPIAVISVIVAVVFMQEGQRRIPIQYAKRQIGRQQTAGGSTYLPLRVNMAGVIPVIFAAAVVIIPQTIAQFFPGSGISSWVNHNFQSTGLLYIGFEALLIILFTYFYTAVQFNPVDQADNLRKQGGYIPGIRPGPPTAQYLDRVLTRLTLPGALYLAAIAALPSLMISYFGFSQAAYKALGGTSILIVVGVALDTMRQMQSQMMMRNYEGFLR
jgi:preprotein translocase subunit SecY